MQTNWPTEEFVDELVTYTLQVDGRLVVIENVPARVCVQTGEKLFAPATVERVQALIRGPATPARVIQTPVFEYSNIVA